MKRSKKKLNKPKGAKLVVGIAWYSSDQWADLRRVVSDPEVIEPTYEAWLSVIKRTVPDFIKKGIELLKVPVDVPELVNWCRHQGRPIDADARAEYVVEALRDRGPSSFESLTTRV